MSQNNFQETTENLNQTYFLTVRKQEEINFHSYLELSFVSVQFHLSYSLRSRKLHLIICCKYGKDFDVLSSYFVKSSNSLLLTKMDG